MKRLVFVFSMIILLTLLIVHIATSSAVSGVSPWVYLPMISKVEISETPTPTITPTNTPTPTITPTWTLTPAPNSGPVLIENGAGSIYTEENPVEVDVAFTPTGTAGEVIEMRVQQGLFNTCPDTIDSAWESFVTEKTYSVFLPAHYHIYTVGAQYRDGFGNVSSIYCDDIIILFPTPSPIPPP